VKIPPPSLSPERAKVDDYSAARSEIIPPLQWTTFSPPFSLLIKNWPERDGTNHGGIGMRFCADLPSVAAARQDRRSTMRKASTITLDAIYKYSL
jgi:hypothetical protein